MNQLFFKINLNKYGELKQAVLKERRTFRTTALAFIVFTAIIYGVVLYYNGIMARKVDNRRQLLADIKLEIKSYKENDQYLSSKDLTNIAEISTDRIFWSKKLVALSEKTSDKIAITNFSFKNDVLSIFGITRLDKNEKEFDLINEFVENLKNNSQISGDFDEIYFVKSNRDYEKDVEIIRFQIDCVHEGSDTIKKRRRR
ncbi:MAG: PilN domain-containing protein [Candidatus Stygibacter australis]|nr:PilN domain-containing protein [Candidatus Stygibacter australis]